MKELLNEGWSGSEKRQTSLQVACGMLSFHTLFHHEDYTALRPPHCFPKSFRPKFRSAENRCAEKRKIQTLRADILGTCYEEYVIHNQDGMIDTVILAKMIRSD